MVLAISASQVQVVNSDTVFADGRAYRLYRERVPHWVVAYDHDGEHVFIHDPWLEPDEAESPINKAALAIPIAEFDRISVYGKSRLRAAVVVEAPGSGLDQTAVRIDALHGELVGARRQAQREHVASRADLGPPGRVDLRPRARRNDGFPAHRAAFRQRARHPGADRAGG